jgi:hypothetical protein
LVWTKVEHLILKRVKVELEGFEKQRDVTEPMNETDTFIYLGLIQTKQIQHTEIKRLIKLQWLVCTWAWVCVSVRVRACALVYVTPTTSVWRGRHAHTQTHRYTPTTLQFQLLLLGFSWCSTASEVLSRVDGKAK